MIEMIILVGLAILLIVEIVLLKDVIRLKRESRNIIKELEKLHEEAFDD